MSRRWPLHLRGTLARSAPPPRADLTPAAAGACERCGGPLPARAMQEGDPFCSARCCRATHGVRDPFEENEVARELAALLDDKTEVKPDAR
jgi:hypothetical protein